MKLYFMKQKAIDYLKANMNSLYMNYYRYNSNEWIYELFEYDPFELFVEIPDFSLSPIIGRNTGQADYDNCMILYTNLKNISESQASDERLWAGLCNGVFYEYVRTRWNYGSTQQKDAGKDANVIISRFFFLGGVRSGLYRNTLSKCWWVGHSTYSADTPDHWNLLDAMGPEDFLSKISDIFYSNTFAGNPVILEGICDGLNFFRQRNQKILVRDHIRPTMQYLNALGGGIILDALSSEDIKNIVIDYIGGIKNGGQSDFIEILDDSEEIEDEIETDGAKEVNVDYQEEKEGIDREVIAIDESAVLGEVETVEYGTTVTVLDRNTNQTKDYTIPKTDEERNLYQIEKLLLGKTKGSVIRLKLKEYEVLSIRW